MTQSRDSHGRFKADHHSRNRAIGLVSVVGALASAAGAALHFGLLDRFLPSSAEGAGHDVPDLALDAPLPGSAGRAPIDFRPDPTAPVLASERESLRPATGPAPTLAEDRGGMRSQTSPVNG